MSAPMRNVDKKRLSEASTRVDAMFKKITLNNITTPNKVMIFGEIIIIIARCKKQQGQAKELSDMEAKTRKSN